MLVTVMWSSMLLDAVLWSFGLSFAMPGPILSYVALHGGLRANPVQVLGRYGQNHA
jgi:hypothetical protein